jgi:GAF domain-containing protein
LVASQLEYQTATSEVLSIIQSVAVQSPARLGRDRGDCRSSVPADLADFRLLRDGVYELTATTDDEAKHMRISAPIVPGRGSITGRAVLERRTVHVPDIQADAEYTSVGRRAVAGPDFRTILCVPLVRDGVAIGVIVLFNRIVRPFTQKQIALVTTFADQA